MAASRGQREACEGLRKGHSHARRARWRAIHDECRYREDAGAIKANCAGVGFVAAMMQADSN
jgi:hypothetical protein